MPTIHGESKYKILVNQIWLFFAYKIVIFTGELLLAHWRPLNLTEICGTDENGEDRREGEKGEEEEEETREERRHREKEEGCLLLKEDNDAKKRDKKGKTVTDIFSQIASTPTLRARLR